MNRHKLLFLIITLVIGIGIFSIYTNVSGINQVNKVDKVNSSDNFDITEVSISENNLKTKSFEGKIELIEKKQFDTVTYILTVRKNLIRLDELKPNKKIDNSLLFNLIDNSVFALQHDKKMYINVPARTFQASSSDKIKVLKTNNTKNISGLKCYQWRVKNTSENTEITYWVSGNQYDFYNKFLKLWNKTDKCYQYYLTIPEATGTLPLQQVERTLLRDIRTTITINKIIPQKVDSNFLLIPKNYSLFTN